MKIHSDTLTALDIQACVPMGCYLVEISPEGSRSRAHGFTVRLSGSNSRNMQGRADKAATWDEWGNFISAIFAQDANAICGTYKSHRDFMLKTQDEYRHVLAGRPDLAPTHTAPWLAGFRAA